MNLEKYGFTKEMLEENIAFDDANTIPARVTAVHRDCRKTQIHNFWHP